MPLIPVLSCLIVFRLYLKVANAASRVPKMGISSVSTATAHYYARSKLRHAKRHPNRAVPALQNLHDDLLEVSKHFLVHAGRATYTIALLGCLPYAHFIKCLGTLACRRGSR